MCGLVHGHPPHKIELVWFLTTVSPRPLLSLTRLTVVAGGCGTVKGQRSPCVYLSPRTPAAIRPCLCAGSLLDLVVLADVVCYDVWYAFAKYPGWVSIFTVWPCVHVPKQEPPAPSASIQLTAKIR